MSPAFDQVCRDALALTDEEKEALVQVLIDHLEPDPAEAREIERAWEEEINRRIQRYERGESRGIPAEEVFKRIEDQYK